MSWIWASTSVKSGDDDGFIKRPAVPAHQRALEEESIRFINERNKREQGKFVQLAVIDRTLKDTVALMRHNVEIVVERGMHVDILVQKSEELTESSKMFLLDILPWYKRWWLTLWGRCCFCQNPKNRAKSQS